MIAEAVNSTEWIDSTSHGIPMRRTGRALHISYEDSLRMLWGDQ